MRTKTYKTADSLLHALRPMGSLWKGNRGFWGFRGQEDAVWPLKPSLVRGRRGEERWRDYIKNDALATAAAVLWAELMVMEDFVLTANRHSLAVPNFHMEEYGQQFRESTQDFERPVKREALRQKIKELSQPHILANIAMGQHYGCPTRLLDWTWKPYVAAYFAAKGASRALRQGRRKANGRMAVYAIDTTPIGVLEEDRDDVVPSDILLVQPPQASNPNIGAQAGFFTLDLMTDGTPFENRLGRLQRTGPLDGTWLYKLTLPLSEAPSLLEILAEDGITAASVFPGYQGVTEEIWERGLWSERIRSKQAHWKNRL
ncbi:hypothetical protein ABI59_15000 [Acidobacteria bacterium Mor1]|nr:hypothetical protein ABI59_15000 [Acidobacteria bacterium Mor1]